MSEIDIWRAGAAKLFKKEEADVTLPERQEFKALYHNCYGAMQPRSQEEALEAVKRVGMIFAQCRNKPEAS
jgi:hypothetical protein